MRAPKIITKNKNEYIFEKEYPNFLMYKNMITGVKECFKKQELGLIRKTNVMKGFKLNPEKVKK